MSWCSICNTFHSVLDTCPSQLKPKFEPIKFEPVIDLEPKFKPLINLEPKFEPIKYEPQKFEPLIDLEPKFKPLINLEPKFEPYKYEQPKFYYCGEPCCPGHPEGSGGRCFPTPGPGCRLGPIGGPTW